MAVILNFVTEALSPLNLDSFYKKKTPYHMDSLQCLKKGSISFSFYALLVYGVAAP